MTLRDRPASLREIIDAKVLGALSECGAHYDIEKKALDAAIDAVLSALPCTLSQLEMIEAGTAVVVPKVPTSAMIHAGDKYGGAGKCEPCPVTDGVWDSMLAARPKG